MPNNPSEADDIGAVLFCFCDEIATVDYASNNCFRADINNEQVNTSCGRSVFQKTLLLRCWNEGIYFYIYTFSSVKRVFLSEGDERREKVL